ncbi:MAG: hypothetical protein Alis3KO_14820 [Aliiglaciecola sp.]
MKDIIDTIVIIGTQRSGTTWLMQVLSQEPTFRVYGEVFREIRSDQFKGDPALRPNMFYLEYCEAKQDKSAMSYVSEVLAEPNKTTVLKLMYDQVRRAPRLRKLLSSPNVLVINVERINIFEIALSKSIARYTGVYHSSGDSQVKEFPLPYQTVYRLMMQEKIKQIICPPLVKWYSKHYYYFSYEELVSNISLIQDALKQHFSHSLVIFDAKSTKWKKTSQSNKYSAIKNFDEINSRLSNSVFREYVK